MMNLQLVNQKTHEVLELGYRVLHASLFADDEQSHVDYLLKHMDIPHGATVLDAGCGVGEVAKLIQVRRPDLKFVLLNISDVQLAECPDGMEKVLGNFNFLPLADKSVDYVMFHYSLCHSANWVTTLREARRVLRDGGHMFINDMLRTGGDNGLMSSLLGCAAHSPHEIRDWTRRAGFGQQLGTIHTAKVQRLRALFDTPEVYDQIFQDVVPATFRLEIAPAMDAIESAFARHDRIGFQFSGGRDSTAALFKLREYWPRMTIYHTDTGDQFPETREVVRQVEAIVGQIVRVQGDVAGVRAAHGLASDLVPVDNMEFGRKVSGRDVKIISRYDCCFRSLMLPTHQRLIDDGITLVIRGQRDDEYAVQPLRSGDVVDGLEVLYPIQDWTGEEVSAYLNSNGLPIAPFYAAGVKRAPECMGCTAWWDEGRAQYMRDHHPAAFKSYAANMKTIRIEIDRQYAMLDD